MSDKTSAAATASSTPLFRLGRVCATPAALEVLCAAGQSAMTMMRRHQHGDWGDLCAEDRDANQRAIQNGSRILSAYVVGGVRLYVITEAADDDGVRSASTLLLAEEY